ncbi:MAG: hypothetical protein KJ607_03185 [Bacteroidetes bacterium]|nr:hypothetical protein [Bacteroidota bacterium]
MNENAVKIEKHVVDMTAATYSLEDEFDKDYKYCLGIAITDSACPTTLVIDQFKVKSKIILEEIETTLILSSTSVAPNDRFFSLFEPIEIDGDDFKMTFSDSGHAEAYETQVFILLANDPEYYAKVRKDIRQ